MGSAGSIAITRDAEGKILSANRNLPMTPAIQPASQQYTYDTAAQITSAGTSYDKMGRATAQNGRSYTWNLVSQLVNFVDGANSASITYDGGNEISSTTASGALQSYLFNYVFPYPALSIVRQKNADLRYYVYTPEGKLLYSIEASGNARRFYHFDELGNTVALTDDNGAVSDTYAVSPYGDIVDHGGVTDNPFTWQGQYGVIQEARGLYYMRDRHYDAFSARFLSRDPYMTPDPRSTEPYAYARGNPLRYIDPLGDVSYNDLQDAGFVIGELIAYAVVADTFGLSTAITPEEVAEIIYDGLGSGDCVHLCTTEGFLILDVVTAYRGLNWEELNNLLTPPKPPPPPPHPALIAAPAPILQPKSAAPTRLADPPAAPPVSPLLAPGAANDAGLLTQDGEADYSRKIGGGLLTQDGGGLLTQDGGGLLTQDGGGLLTQDGGGLLTQDGSSLLGKRGGG